MIVAWCRGVIERSGREGFDVVVKWQICGVRAEGRGELEQRKYVVSLSRYYGDVAVPCIQAARIPSGFDVAVKAYYAYTRLDLPPCFT